MREGLRGTGRRLPAWGDRLLQSRRYRHPHAPVPEVRDAAAQAGLEPDRASGIAPTICPLDGARITRHGYPRTFRFAYA
jgi:hypothetical protein